jgi:hypothetical protein
MKKIARKRNIGTLEKHKEMPPRCPPKTLRKVLQVRYTPPSNHGSMIEQNVCIMFYPLQSERAKPLGKAICFNHVHIYIGTYYH